ncbi:MAG: gamma-glutamylcyclotransferase family protein [bacterium]
MQRLFVYGSLKRGERHHAELAGARFVRVARTAPRYALVLAGEYPGLVAEGASRVCGEVFEVDVASLAGLDAFEEVPDSYLRDWIELDDGERVLAYLLAPRLAREAVPLASDCWPIG